MDQSAVPSAAAASSTPQQARKRRRPALACEQCRRRKVRCDRSVPCANCVRSKPAEGCVYQDAEYARSRKPAPGSVAASLSPGGGGSGGGEFLAARGAAPATAAAVAVMTGPRGGEDDGSDDDEAMDDDDEAMDDDDDGSDRPRSWARRRAHGSEEGLPFRNRAPSFSDACGLLPPPWKPGLGADGGRRQQQQHRHANVGGGPPTDAAALAARVRQLERQLEDLSVAREGREYSAELRDDSDHHHHHQQQQRRRSQSSLKGILAKSRFFGQSHWIHGAEMFPLITRIVVRGEMQRSGGWHEVQRCKRLARSIKAQRAGGGTGGGGSGGRLGTHLPGRELADSLVDAYLRTFESVYRILHVPTFRAECDAFWRGVAAFSPTNTCTSADAVAFVASSPSCQSAAAFTLCAGNNSSNNNNNNTTTTTAPGGTPSAYFVVQLQLVMAVGAAFHDWPCSLRASAMRWVHEAQLWLLRPPEKSRMNVPGLQAMCLLHLARETAAAGADLVWVSAGTLMRTAMYMGLHRDPAHLPRMTPLKAEIRRRLWATVLEMLLQSSIESGGPPLVSFRDFDTVLPLNVDDDDLAPERGGVGGGGARQQQTAAELPRARPPSELTDTTAQLALAASFPVRLAVAKFLNDFRSSSSYDETLALHAALTTACRVLAVRLQTASSSSSSGPPSVKDRDAKHHHHKQHQRARRRVVSDFQLRLAEMMTHRFFIALHKPWLSQAYHDPAFHFSRKILLETSLRLFGACCAGMPAGAANNSGPPPPPPSTSATSSPASGLDPASSSTSSHLTSAAHTPVGTPSTNTNTNTAAPASSSVFSTAAATTTPLLDFATRVLISASTRPIPPANPSADYAHLVTCASGGFRSVPVQTVLIMGLELLTQIEEDATLGLGPAGDGGGGIALSTPFVFAAGTATDDAAAAGGADAGDTASPGTAAAASSAHNNGGQRAELLATLRRSVAWADARVRAGETNVKGQIVTAALLAQVEAVLRYGGTPRGGGAPTAAGEATGKGRMGGGGEPARVEKTTARGAERSERSMGGGGGGGVRTNRESPAAELVALGRASGIGVFVGQAPGEEEEGEGGGMDGGTAAGLEGGGGGGGARRSGTTARAKHPPLSADDERRELVERYVERAVEESVAICWELLKGAAANVGLVVGPDGEVLSCEGGGGGSSNSGGVAVDAGAPATTTSSDPDPGPWEMAAAGRGASAGAGAGGWATGAAGEPNAMDLGLQDLDLDWDDLVQNQSFNFNFDFNSMTWSFD